MKHCVLLIEPFLFLQRRPFLRQTKVIFQAELDRLQTRCVLVGTKRRRDCLHRFVHFLHPDRVFWNRAVWKILWKISCQPAEPTFEGLRKAVKGWFSRQLNVCSMYLLCIVRGGCGRHSQRHREKVDVHEFPLQVRETEETR